MPISDCSDYTDGHFGRVYEHIIKPACEFAGFKAVRADDIMTTNYIALDVIKNIIESDMALCDLSSRNPNVLYELGIRQAFNLPVTLVKDTKTKRIFDIQGFRDIEYDESLRIDTVETTVENLGEVLKNTYENRTTEINSLITLLGIEPAKLSERKKISSDTELILNSLTSLDKRMALMENRVRPSPIVQSGQPILPIPDNVGEPLTKTDIDALKEGDRVYHIRFGAGTISSMQGTAQKIVTIKFDNGVVRRMVISIMSQNYRKFKQ